MANKRFEHAPKFVVKNDSVVIQQAVDGTSPLLEMKSHSGSVLMSINAAGQMSASAASTFADFTATTSASLPSSTSIGNISSTELGYLDGITSTVQTQIDSKSPIVSPTFTGTVVLPSTTSIGTVSSTELGHLDGVTSALQTQINSKAPTASPTFTGTISAATITASGTVKGSGSVVQIVSNSQGASDLTSAGYIGTVTMTPKFANSTILVLINYHAYKYNSLSTVNNYYQLRNITGGTVIRENPYLTYGPPDYMFQGVISGVQSAGSTSSRQYGLLVDSTADQRIYFYWSTTYAMEIAA